AIEEQILQAVVAPTKDRVGRVAPQGDLVVGALDLDQGSGQFLADQRGDPLAPVAGGGQVVDLAIAMDQAAMDLGVRQGDSDERLIGVPMFGLWAAEESLPDRRVEKQIADLDD